MALEPCDACRCHGSAPAMAEGRFQDNAEAGGRSGASPSFCSSLTKVGIPPQRARILLDLQRGYRVGPGCAHDGIGSIVALPGGVVRRVERLRK